MYVATLPIFLLLSAPILALPSSTAPDNACASGLRLISVRGSGEPPGPGKFTDLIQGIQAAVPDTTSDPLDYPAVLKPYKPSEEAGVTNLTKAIKAHHTSCPGVPLVLMGSSQGAQVVADTLSGGGGMPAIDGKFVDNLLAVTIFGDPTHIGGTDYDRGNCTGHGRLDRGSSSAAILESYASKLRSYCVEGDHWCCSGNTPGVHGNEVQTNTAKALSFIKEMANAAGF